MAALSVRSTSVVPVASSTPTPVGNLVATPLIWPGRKDWIEKKVARYIPADATRLVDVFMGSGTVSLILADRFQSVLMTDSNPDLVGLFQAMADDPEALIAEATPLFDPANNTKPFYYTQKERFNRDAAGRTAARFLFLNRRCYGGMMRYNKSGGFNVAAGNRKTTYLPVGEIRGFGKRLPHASFEHADFRVTMAKLGRGDFAVVDGPYLDSDITYTKDGFSNQDQEDLAAAAEAAAKRGATVVVFNHDTPMARKLYKQASRIVGLQIPRKYGKHEKAKEVMAVYQPAPKLEQVKQRQTVAPTKIEAAPVAAANDARFAGWNEFGVIDIPKLAVTFSGKANKADATLWAHPVEGKWFAGFDFAFRTGEYHSETRLPSKLDAGCETASLAVKRAADQLLADLAGRFPDLKSLVKDEAKQVKAIRGWLNAQIDIAQVGGFEEKPAFTFIDLFAGIGGFHLAMKQAGGKCVLACEKDEEARKTYLANHNMTDVPFAADITRLSVDDVPDHDVLCAGFPCQPYSIAGGKRGFEDQRGGLIFDMLRIIRGKLPKVLLLENVKNFCVGSNGAWHRTLRRELGGMGYAISSKVLNAAHFGTAQERERVFFVAYHRDAFAEVQGFQFPVGDGKWVSVADILEADAPEGRRTLADIALCPTVNKNSPLQRIGFLKTRSGKTRRGQDARVYDPAFHATTLMASQDNCGVYLVNGKARSLTPRERARLQGFPDTFKPHPDKSDANKQFGNGIAVPVVAAIGHAVANQFFNHAA